MRTLLGLVLFFGSLIISFSAYSLGLKNKQCDCGCCPGLTGVPNVPMLYYNQANLKPPPIDLEYCAIIGCSSPRIPIYGLGAFFFLIGLYFLTKGPKSSLM